MLNRIYVNYDEIVRNTSSVIDFLSRKTEQFSILVSIKKPYSQIPPSFDYDLQFLPFAEKYIFDMKDWPVDFLGQLRHQIMVICNCCKESRKQLLKMPNIFLPIEGGLPEDICFYRENKLVFATISHEKIAFLANATEADIEFFNNLI